jgi:anti-anti-sigma factor
MLIEMEQHDSVSILHCKGRFVAGPEMEYMQNKLDDIKRLPCTKMLMDFEDVTSLGSMGVTFILGAYTSVTRRQGGRFILAGANAHVLHVLDLTHVSAIIPLAPDVASGLAALRAETPVAVLAFSNNASVN